MAVSFEREILRMSSITQLVDADIDMISGGCGSYGGSYKGHHHDHDYQYGSSPVTVKDSFNNDTFNAPVNINIGNNNSISA